MRLENIFELLNIWTQYVEVIYMPEAELQMIDHLKNMEGRLPDESYARVLERDDASKRLKMLFKPDEPESGEKKDANENVNLAYESVNEGDTTDTTTGLDDDESLIASTKRLAPETAKTQSTLFKKSKKAVEEGIKSSDEEAEVEE